MSIINKNFEDKVLAGLLRSNQFCAVAAPNLRSSYFEGAMQKNIAKIALDFFTKFNTTITAIAMIEGIKDLERRKIIKAKELPVYGAELKRMQPIDLSDQDWVLEELVKFIKAREIRNAIDNAVTHSLPKDDFKAVEDAFAKISSIGTQVDRGYTKYFSEDAIQARVERREAEMKSLAAGYGVGISSGIKKMDEVLPKGGFYNNELYVFLAPPKSGKTMSLLWFGNSAAMQGKNVAFFTCETSTEVCNDRLDALNSGIEIRGLPANLAGVAKTLNGKRPKNGELFFFQYPTKTLTPREVERQVKKLQLQEGVDVDMIIVDYGDIMKPDRSYRDDNLKEQASIFEDLRRLAGEFNVPMVTATQVNRSGSSKSLIRGEDVAGTFEKIMVADYIISFSSSDEDKRKGHLKIHFAQCRNAESRTIKIKTSYIHGKFYDEFIEEVH